MTPQRIEVAVEPFDEARTSSTGFGNDGIVRTSSSLHQLFRRTVSPVGS
jgi:hypothetical protein